MPIHIFCDADASNPRRTVADLGEYLWDLPDQISELEDWLESNFSILTESSYVADIGFRVREDATGGGAVLSKKLISMLHKISMEVYFSEYG